MNYYVVFPDGQKFGPADLTLLNQWATENRINPQTQLEVVETGEKILAGAVTGIMFTAMQQPAQPQYQAPDQTQQYQQPQDPQNPYQQGAPGPGQIGQSQGQVYNPYQNPQPQQGQYNPYASPYNRGGMGGDDGSKEITNSYICTAIGFFCCFIVTIFGITNANTAVAKGNPGGTTARTVAIVVLCLQVVGTIAYMIAIAASGASGFR